MSTITGYGPDGQIIEQTVDNGDGTGVYTDYRTDPPTVVQLSGLPITDPPRPSAEDRIAVLEAPPDPEAATAVKAELARLATQADAARALATQFRGSTGTQKNAIVAERFDDVLNSLADTYDTIALLIRAAVRG